MLELVLSGESVVPAHLDGRRGAACPGDLPPGPFRSRIAALVDVRALLPQLRVRMSRSTGVWRDRTGKVVAIAELHEDVRVVGPAGRRSAFTTIEIHEVTGVRQTGPTRPWPCSRTSDSHECETDTLTQCAAAAGVDLAGFTATATVPLDPTMAAIDGFRARARQPRR